MKTLSRVLQFITAVELIALPSYLIADLRFQLQNAPMTVAANKSSLTPIVYSDSPRHRNTPQSDRPNPFSFLNFSAASDGTWVWGEAAIGNAGRGNHGASLVQTFRALSGFPTSIETHQRNDVDLTIVPKGSSLPTLILKQHPAVVGNTPTFNATNENETMVILLGDLRCGELAWESLYRNLLDVNNADLAIWTQSSGQHPESSLLQRAVHVELVPRYEDWTDAIDWLIRQDAEDGAQDVIGQIPTNWWETVTRMYPSTDHPLILGGVNGGYISSAAIVYVFRWLVARRIVQQSWHLRYKRFVITRTDQYYSCPVHLSINQETAPGIHLGNNVNHIQIPRGQDFGGITDRFYVIDSTDVVDSLLVLPRFLQNPKFLQNLTNINPETLLWAVWKQYGWVADDPDNNEIRQRVRRFRRPLFTCMSPGDSSNWNRSMQGEVPEGVHLKYPSEYQKISRNCAARSRPTRP